MDILKKELNALIEELNALIQDEQWLTTFARNNAGLISELTQQLLRQKAAYDIAQKDKSTQPDTDVVTQDAPAPPLTNNATAVSSAETTPLENTQSTPATTDQAKNPYLDPVGSATPSSPAPIAEHTAAHTAPTSSPVQNTMVPPMPDAKDPQQPAPPVTPDTLTPQPATAEPVPMAQNAAPPATSEPQQPQTSPTSSETVSPAPSSLDVMTTEQTTAPAATFESQQQPATQTSSEAVSPEPQHQQASSALPNTVSPAPASPEPMTMDQNPAPMPTPEDAAKSQPPLNITLPILPNATMGKAYHFPFPQDHQNYKILKVTFDTDFGLKWDHAQNALTGSPTDSGNKTLTFEIYDAHHQRIESITQILIINADPRSLWQDLPTDPNQPFQKPNTASDKINTPHGTLLAARRRGRSHAHVGSFCDDDMRVFFHEKSGVHVLVVSDGAGSASFSRYGSQLVVEAAISAIENKLNDEANIYTKIAQPEMKDDDRKQIATSLMHNAVWHAWNRLAEAVKNNRDVIRHEKELSCTLLIVLSFQRADGRWYSCGYQIGDGAIALYWPESKTFKTLGKPDSGEFSGETRFLTKVELEGDRLLQRIVEVPSSPIPPVIFAMTDGVSDPIFQTDDGLQDTDNWQKFWLELQAVIEAQDQDQEQALLEWLNFWSKGEHDDRTLAMFIPTRHQGSRA